MGVVDRRSRRFRAAATLGPMRRAASLLCLAGALLATLGLAPARAQSGGPVVEVFEASGVLDASVLGALRRDLDGAQRRGARVMLVQLSSFGGLGVDPAEVRSTVAGFSQPDSARFSRLPTDTQRATRLGASSASVAMAMATGSGGHR